MEVTRIYTETLEAIADGYRYIENRGGSRSSKTFSQLQVFKTISDYSTKKEINSIVSHSLPHLKGGAIRDFDKILHDEGINIDLIRTKDPYIYTLGNQIIEFIGFDNPGKTLGATRNRLFINEANKMPFEICHQLMQRTTDLILYDYNPSFEFWAQEEGYSTKSDCKVINSTFLDNIHNLTQGQIDDFAVAKIKHDDELRRGIKGYWYNYWRVYGLGLDGMLEGAIFHNWEKGDFDDTLPYGYGQDFGSKDPDATVKCAVNHKEKKIYLKEEVYKNELSSGELAKLIKATGIGDKLLVCDSSAPRTITDLKKAGINAVPVVKPPVVDSIKQIQNYQLIIDPSSTNLIYELLHYVWLDKKGEVPIDKHNHLIDAARYIITKLINPIKRSKTKLVRR
jgi:phage terminase large subunit